jgi:HK97 family phage major capsid protein
VLYPLNASIGEKTPMTAGEKRKLYRNLQEQPSARRLAVVGLNLAVFCAPVALVLFAILFLMGHSFSDHASGLALAASPVMLPMANIKVLRQRKFDLNAEATAILTAADPKTGFTDEQRTKLDALAKDKANVEQDIVRVEAFMDTQREVPAVGAAARAGASNEAKKPYARLSDQLADVVAAARGKHPSDRLLEINAAASGGSEGVPADGGFAVQTDFSTALLDKSHETGVIASKVFRINLGANSNSIKLPAIDETSRVTGSRWGGVQVYYAAEADTVTAKKPKFRAIELSLKKLFGLSYATDELLQDFGAYEQIINRALPEEFGYQIDDDILNGTGAGKPLGINNHPALVPIAKDANQTGVTFTVGNAVRMFARMPARLIGGAEWFLNQDVLPQLPQMVIGQQPVYLPPTGLAGSTPFGMLLGRPINVIEQAETLGSQGDVIFANFGEYVMIEKGGLQQESSMHVRFLNDEMTFRWTLRLDGQPAWNAALTPAKGASTLSPFIEVAVRA